MGNCAGAVCDGVADHGVGSSDRASGGAFARRLRVRIRCRTLRSQRCRKCGCEAAEDDGGGDDSGERLAAARAAAGYGPPGYRLRLAEWGVWCAGAGPEEEQLQGVLEEIPAFVHATGDDLCSFRGRPTRRRGCAGWRHRR